MSYRRGLPNGIVISSTQPEHAKHLELLEKIIFPTLLDAECHKEAHYKKHIEIFPEGQFVALDGDRVVGMTASIRLNFDFNHPDHTVEDVFQGGWLTAHEPEGVWLYGAEIGTHPDYRRRGIARELYAARQETVRQLGLRGQVTVGMLNGYGKVKDAISAQDYYEKLVSGEITDPTVSAQMRVGFTPQRLIANYVNDPACDNYGVLLVWDACQHEET